MNPKFHAFRPGHLRGVGDQPTERTGLRWVFFGGGSCENNYINWLVVEPTHLKNMFVKLDYENPNFRAEHKNIFELQPPRILELLEDLDSGWIPETLRGSAQK